MRIFLTAKPPRARFRLTIQLPGLVAKLLWAAGILKFYLLNFQGVGASLTPACWRPWRKAGIATGSLWLLWFMVKDASQYRILTISRLANDNCRQIAPDILRHGP